VLAPKKNAIMALSLITPQDNAFPAESINILSGITPDALKIHSLARQVHMAIRP